MEKVAPIQFILKENFHISFNEDFLSKIIILRFCFLNKCVLAHTILSHVFF